MVATRKKPSAPAPPASRTHSTQALPRAVGAKASHSNLTATSDTHSNSTPAPNKAEPNGIANVNSKKSKSPSPPQVRRKKRSPLDRLFLLTLSTFVAYVLYNCPSDSTFSNPVCRSLASYRTHVLEPYIIPSIRAAVTHPTVVEPFEKYAKPMYQNYIEPVTPYVAAANRRAAPYVDKAISTSTRASQRVWNNVIRVYWMRAVVPQYQYHVQPLVEKYVSPIIKRVNPHVQEFTRQTSVYAHRTQEGVQYAYDSVQPYVATTYAFVKPGVIRGYAFAKPYSLRAAGIAQTQGKSLASGTMVIARSALGRMGVLRKEFVDPHVLRIWEKAVEKSGISATPSTVVTQTELSFAEETSTADLPVASEVPVAEPPVDTATPTAIETLEKAASVAEQSAPHASNVIEELQREIKMTEAAQEVVTPTPQPEMTPEPTPSDHPEAEPDLPSETPVIDHATTEDHSPPTDEDVDDFLKEIGFDEEEKIPEAEPEVQEPTPQVDHAARKAATAIKRAKIVGRHVRWQSQLDELAKDMEIQVKKELLAIREEAVAALGHSSAKDSFSGHGKGQEVMEKIQIEGEKLLKGLEAYVKKVMAREIKPEDQEKEQQSYDKVVDKVDTKFGDVIQSVEEEARNWLMSIREKEISAVVAASYKLKTVADQAQSDLGLDYAWLDDVTYQDWQKYHDLLRTYERFDQFARSLQNGTHPEAPEDKLLPAFSDLQEEVQTMISGFGMRMSALVRDGERWLAGVQPIAEPETGDEDLSNDADEPPVSILPIEPEISEKDIRPEDVIIGKSPEQVEKMGQQAQHILERTEL